MRTITIKSKGLGRYNDVSPFLVENGELKLKIALPNKSGEFFFVCELNGKKCGIYPIFNGEVVLAGLLAGELKAEVKHYLRGELVETYRVEPLLLKSVETKLSATPEIAFLTAECKDLRDKSEAVATEAERQADETEKRIRAVELAFLAYAWADYQNNVQLNAKNLSLADFAAALGYRLTEEEFEQINGKKEAF